MQTENLRKPYFALLSFLLSLTAFVATFIMLSPLFKESFRRHDNLQFPSMTLVYVMWISFFFGIVCTIISFIRKERSAWYKYAGLAIISLYLIILFLTVFLNVIL